MKTVRLWTHLQRNSYRLWSETCIKTFRIQIGWTNTRTTKECHNAFLWRPQKAILGGNDVQVQVRAWPWLGLRIAGLAHHWLEVENHKMPSDTQWNTLHRSQFVLAWVIQNSKALMKIPGNWPIFYLWPIQKLLHFGIPDRVQSNAHLHEFVYLISRVMEVSNSTGHTSNLWQKCPLYKGCNATGRPISWEIHYRPFESSDRTLLVLFPSHFFGTQSTIPELICHTHSRYRGTVISFEMSIEKRFLT